MLGRQQDLISLVLVGVGWGRKEGVVGGISIVSHHLVLATSGSI